MPQWMPFGNDTLVIPFTWAGRAPRRRGSGMSRLRPAGKLYRYGVRRTAPDDEGQFVRVSDDIPDAQKSPFEKTEEEDKRGLGGLY